VIIIWQLHRRELRETERGGPCRLVVSVNGTLVGDKIRRFKRECAHLAFTSVPLIITMVQVPNLALIHTERITVWGGSISVYVVTGRGYRDTLCTIIDLWCPLQNSTIPKNGKNEYEIKCNFSFILYGIAMSREAASLPPFLFIHHIFQPLVLCERKN
jgi:hypothetical protein